MFSDGHLRKAPRRAGLRLALRARTQGFEPPGMDGAVCKAMMLRIVTPGTARAYQDATTGVAAAPLPGGARASD
jgi:hypothetical protein